MGFFACKGSEYEEEPKIPEIPKDPLANVLYNMDSIYIIKGAYADGDSVYNDDGEHIRRGKNPDGAIAYTLKGEFIYKGDVVKGLPVYCLQNNYICRYTLSGVLQAILWRDKQYFRRSSLVFPRPISYYGGEVAFNIDGNFLRQGRDKSGRVLFSINGDNYHQGEGARGSIVFNRDGEYLRMGSQKTGAIIFTIKDDLIYKGKDSQIVSFNVDNNLIRKGRAKLSIGEN